MITLFEYLKRPDISWETFDLEEASVFSDQVLERIEIKAKYSGYLTKQENELRQLDAFKALDIDLSRDINLCPGLSREVVEKYNAMRPKRVYDLFRISGITPTAVLSIARFAGRRASALEGGVSRETLRN